MHGPAVFEQYIDAFAVTEDVLLQPGFRRTPPDFYVLVAGQDGDLLGMLVYYLVPFTATARPTLYMKELYVREDARGHQIGERLMRAAAGRAWSAGAAR